MTWSGIPKSCSRSVCLCVCETCLCRVRVCEGRGERLLCPRNFPGETLEQVPFPTPGAPPDPGIDSSPLAPPALADPTTVPPGKHTLGAGYFHNCDCLLCIPCPASAVPNWVLSPDICDILISEHLELFFPLPYSFVKERLRAMFKVLVDPTGGREIVVLDKGPALREFITEKVK